MFAKPIVTILTTLALVLTPSSGQGISRVNLGSAGNYVILAKTGISTTSTTSIVGSIAISPAAATMITGFGLTLSSDGTYSTSGIIPAPGKVYAASYSAPTPTILTSAVLDMEAAYTDAAGRPPPNSLNYGAGALNGQIMGPGLYTWTTPVSVGGSVTISGTSTDIWIFQISGTLTFGSGAEIILGGAANCSNIFWQVAGQITFGSTSVPMGIFLGKTAAAFNPGASLPCGRVLVQSAVTLIGNAITQP